MNEQIALTNVLFNKVQSLLTSSKFLDTLDDTLINRLCSSLFCLNFHHTPLTAKWNVLLEKLVTNSDTHTQELSAKLTITLVFCCSHLMPVDLKLRSVSHVKNLINSNKLDIKTILDLVSRYISLTTSVSKFDILIDIFDSDIVIALLNSPMFETNILFKKGFVNLLASLLTYHCIYRREDAKLLLPSALLHHFTQLTPFAVSVLYNVGRQLQRLQLTPMPIVQISVEPREDSQELDCHIVYLYCLGLIKLEDDGQPGHQLDAKLCTQILSIHLTRGGKPSGELWHDIGKAWCRYFLASFDQSCLPERKYRDDYELFLPIDQHFLLEFFDRLIKSRSKNFELWSLFYHFLANYKPSDVQVFIDILDKLFQRLQYPASTVFESDHLLGALSTIVENRDDSIVSYIATKLSRLHQVWLFTRRINLADQLVLLCEDLVPKITHEADQLITPLIDLFTCVVEKRRFSRSGPLRLSEIGVHAETLVRIVQLFDSIVQQNCSNGENAIEPIIGCIELLFKRPNKQIFPVDLRIVSLSLMSSLIRSNIHVPLPFDQLLALLKLVIKEGNLSEPATELSPGLEVNRLDTIDDERVHPTNRPHLDKYRSLLRAKVEADMGKEHLIWVERDLRKPRYEPVKCRQCYENRTELLDDILVARPGMFLDDCSEG